jgi:hypothetical protein
MKAIEKMPDCSGTADNLLEDVRAMVSSPFQDKAKENTVRRCTVFSFGSPGWARTSDILVNSEALYH